MRLKQTVRAGSYWSFAGAVLAALSLVAAVGCGGDGEEGDGEGESSSFHESCTATVEPGESPEETTDRLERAFVEVESGEVICMRDGDYQVNGEMNVTVDDVVVRGESQEGTVLDFSDQEQGANGILVQGTENFGALNFTVKNTPSDAIKTKGVDGVVMKNLTVTWDRGPSEENGAYALYPVEAKNVLVEGCEVSHARDAGVYLGQSETAIVRDNEAYGNVIGIEIENTYRAEVYDNYAHGNTDGFLIINLPDLQVKGGGDNLIYDNEIEENNLENFGPPETTVSNMPPGTGLLMLATDGNEVRNNEIRNNDSIGIGIINYELLEEGGSDDEEFDPYSEGNWVHDNTVTDNGGDPQREAQLLATSEGEVPQVFWDGVYDESKDNTDGSLTNCFADNATADGTAVEAQIVESTRECPSEDEGDPPSICQIDCSQSEVDPVELPERVLEMAE